MPSLIISHDADADWNEVRDDWPGKAKADEPGLIYKRLMPRETGMPNVHHIRYDANHFEPPHSHDEDEVFYIVAGEMGVGTRKLTPGDSVFIGRNTRYSATAGPEGCDFVRVGMTIEGYGS